MGIKWWKLLKAIRPKIPKKINAELRKELTDNDITELQEKFGLHPTRGDLDAIEEFLRIDLYIMVAGEFSPVCITRRPARLRDPMTFRQAFRELESSDGDLPVVILQSNHNYFHELGDFYLFPTYTAALNFNSKWKNLWNLVVEKRWPGLNANETYMKIKEIKVALSLAHNEIFSIGDGVFKRLKQKYGVTVSIFTANVINDNRNEKSMIYTTDKWQQNKEYHLNILVANYMEYEFYRVFETKANLEYGELLANPDLRPTMIYDKKQKRCKRRAENLTNEAVNAMYNFGRSGTYTPPVYHDPLDDLEDFSSGDEGPNTMSSFIVEDRTTYTKKKISMPKSVSQFFDNDCQVSTRQSDVDTDAATVAGSDVGTVAGSDTGTEPGTEPGTVAGSETGTETGTEPGTENMVSCHEMTF